MALTFTSALLAAATALGALTPSPTPPPFASTMSPPTPAPRSMASPPRGTPAGVGAEASGGTAGRPVPGGRWRWPLAPRPRLGRLFDPPRERWQAGHRGLDLLPAAPPSGGGSQPGGAPPVLAVAAGRVSFAGRVGGKPVIAVDHPGGLRSTYEPVVSDVAVGSQVAAGTRIGTLASSAGHCAEGACLHLGARRGREYVDPLPLLRAGRVVLLPTSDRP